ncbi:protein GAST1-like [Morus notabilis]|uniref:protein GAST1-like n=1 Tax=Morus notabilis TaxID=981085 RepID=UPI000CED4479|nr:protein GAST1-like [Morus notabilis]
MTRKLSILILFVAFMLVFLAEIQALKVETQASQQKKQKNQPVYGSTQGSLHPQECAPRCTSRCSATAYKKPCMFFCQKCCAKCLCVPPGTYGNKQLCPCYNNWKTKRGGPKCP